MKLKEIEETLTNLQVAEKQLERSITLFLDNEDYISALTLAGAAEEILGKLLNKQDSEHWLDDITKGALMALGFRKKTFNTSEAKQAKKEIANIANHFKNRMKHYNNDGSVTFYVDTEAANMIDRAISNYFKLTQRETGAMGRFKELIIFGDMHA